MESLLYTYHRQVVILKTLSFLVPLFFGKRESVTHFARLRPREVNEPCFELLRQECVLRREMRSRADGEHDTTMGMGT